ncbi:MAG: hypothetical protein R3C11_11665 [Planctomycetaceae bacterium]
MNISVIPENRPGWVEQPYGPDVPLSVPSIGVAFNLINRVLKVEEGSPAQQAGIQANDAIVSLEFLPPADQASKAKSVTVSFDQTLKNWAYAVWMIQYNPTRELKLTYSRNNNVESVNLNSVESKEWFVPSSRGIYLLPQNANSESGNSGRAVNMGFTTVHSILLRISI